MAGNFLAGRAACCAWPSEESGISGGGVVVAGTGDRGQQHDLQHAEYTAVSAAALQASAAIDSDLADREGAPGGLAGTADRGTRGLEKANHCFSGHCPDELYGGSHHVTFGRATARACAICDTELLWAAGSTTDS